MIEPCTTHPEAAGAGWRCDGCKKLLCGECTARAANLFYCSQCGASATQITRERTDRTFSAWMLGAFAYPVTRGLAIVAVAAIVLGGAGFTFTSMGNDYAGWSVAVRSIMLAAFALLVVDSSARGSAAERGVAMRLLRALLATLILWGPMAIYAYFLGAPTKHDWTILMFAGLAAIYVPIALAVAVTDVSIGAAMNPFVVFDFAWTLGRRYLQTLVAVLVLGGLAIGIYTSTAEKLARSVTAPVAGDIAAILPGLAMLAVVLHAIGLLVYVHGEALGFGAASMYRDPILPNAVASGRRKDAAVVTTASLTKMSDAIVAGATPEERGDLRKIVDHLKSENTARALKIYETRASWSATAFDDRQLLALGKAAQRAKSYPLAQRLYEQGIALESRGTSQLMIALAQLLGDVLEQPEAARDLYQKIATKFPGTDAAKVAQQRLGS